ncbi:hypothetical protein OPQ81_004740 [Rhizoctonia solani]|nr:hypothetical protein OPQ81_004740 [Rhizoctonia solani]
MYKPYPPELSSFPVVLLCLIYAWKHTTTQIIQATRNWCHRLLQSKVNTTSTVLHGIQAELRWRQAPMLIDRWADSVPGFELPFMDR